MDEKPFEPVDALGRIIVIGDRYGYTSTSSGRSRTVIGYARKLTKSGLVTISIIEVKNFLYGRPVEISWDEADQVNIRPHMLFPLNHV